MFSSGQKRTVQLLILALTFVVPHRAEAVAYCALRDPVFAMQSFFPDFSSYRSYLGIVGEELREVLEEKLPYELHFNEFGKHTLYVAFNGQQATGLVHARTEKGDWGLDELIWSLNMDLTVRDFRFQRSRSRWQEEVQSPAFKEILNGKDFNELLLLLSADGSELSMQYPDLPPGADRLAATVIRSALKTIIVTDHVWSNQLQLDMADRLSLRGQ